MGSRIGSGERLGSSSGEMADADDDRSKRRERVRTELIKAGTKQKKGFMTPERKKKLRVTIRKHVAKQIKIQQENEAKERKRVVDQRCGQPKSLEGLGNSELRRICEEYQKRIVAIENSKYDIEKEVDKKAYKIDELHIAVSDLRGKFIKPTLKKVSKYENKFARLQKKAGEFNFRQQLKAVTKKEYTMEEEGAGEHKKPDWAIQMSTDGAPPSPRSPRKSIPDESSL